MAYKMVLNKCYRGFELSQEALQELERMGYENEPWELFAYRGHPALVEVVERLGTERAGAQGTKLTLVALPDGIDVRLLDYDGFEAVVENGHFW